MKIYNDCELIIDVNGTIWVNNNKTGACLLRVSKISTKFIKYAMIKEYFDITSKE